MVVHPEATLGSPGKTDHLERAGGTAIALAQATRQGPMNVVWRGWTQSPCRRGGLGV